jgi:putative DNA primase/helicase
MTLDIKDENDPRNYEDHLVGMAVESAVESLHDATDHLGLFDLIEVKGKPGEETKYRRNLFQQDVVKAFVAIYSGILRYDGSAGQWLFFTGSKWVPVKAQQVVAPFLKRLSIGFDDRQRREMLSVNYAEAIERGARSAAGISTTSQWDTDPDVIGTPNGVVDLRTGKVRPMTAGSLIRKATAVGLPHLPPEVVEELAKEGKAIELPDCPIWGWFLKDRFGDDETIAFVQRYFGYCLTGRIHEQRLLYLYGGGGNGKNLLAETIAFVMGDYARNAAIETVTEQRGSRHMSELAVLNGARFVRVSEPPAGFEWNEKRLKTITGDEKITANLKHKDEIEFLVTFKIAIMANPPPTFKDTGESMQRRVIAIKLPEVSRPDHHLSERLREEGSAILRWLIQGSVDWYANGLRVPEKIVAGSRALVKEGSPFDQWLSERCVKDSGSTRHRELWADWSAWAKLNGHHERSGMWLSNELKGRNYTKRMNDGSWFDGVSLSHGRL